jgi:hypothetical protein
MPMLAVTLMRGTTARSRPIAAMMALAQSAAICAAPPAAGRDEHDELVAAETGQHILRRSRPCRRLAAVRNSSSPAAWPKNR